MTPPRIDAHPALGASSFAVLIGIWIFLSPWIYGAYGSSSGWNGWIAGALICILAIIRRGHPAKTGLSWINAALGVWIFISPWVYGYTGTGHFVNSLCAGIILFATSIVAANSEWMSHHTA